MKRERAQDAAYDTDVIYRQSSSTNTLKHIGISYLWMAGELHLMCQLQPVLNNHMKCYAGEVWQKLLTVLCYLFSSFHSDRSLAVCLGWRLQFWIHFLPGVNIEWKPRACIWPPHCAFKAKSYDFFPIPSDQNVDGIVCSHRPWK